MINFIGFMHMVIELYTNVVIKYVVITVRTIYMCVCKYNIYVSIMVVCKYVIIVFIKQALTWQYAEKGDSVFKVTATNNCGQATGCFKLRACVRNCTYYT